MELQITHDEEVDVAYLSLAEGKPKSVRQKVVEIPGGTIIVDFDDEDAIIGIEVLGARKLLRHAIAQPVRRRQGR